jgi:hypothetical protein
MYDHVGAHSQLHVQHVFHIYYGMLALKLEIELQQY